MITFARSFIALSMIVLLSCGKEEANLFDRYRLEPSVKKVGDLQAAIDLINPLLAARALPEFYIYKDETQDGKVAVVWVGDRSLSQSVSDMLFVPDQCHCVIAQPKIYFEWIKNYSTVGGTNYSDSDDAIRILAYFLIHELGHIQYKHPGRAASDTTKTFNALLTQDKQREQNADDFASELISSYVADLNNFDPWMKATNISIAISALASNLQGKRIIDDFACSILDAPCAFHDMGDTHYNLEYRILKAQCLISSQFCEILSAYEERRNSGGVFPDGILYHAEPIGTKKKH